MILRHALNAAKVNLFKRAARSKNCWEITRCKELSTTDVFRYGNKERLQTFDTKSGRLDISTHSYPGGAITREADGTYTVFKLGAHGRDKEIILGKFNNFPDFAAAVRKFVTMLTSK